MTTYHIRDYMTSAESDIQAAFCRCFEEACGGGHIVIDPGEYRLTGQIPLFSNISVYAYGAVLCFPEELVSLHSCMFYGEEIHDLSWEGGTFKGYVYNPEESRNLWPPSAETIGISIVRGSHITFDSIKAQDLAGPCVAVFGEPETLSSHITLKDLQLHNCGKFMWDYGYLWQRITFPEYHTVCEVENAYQNMPKEYYSEPLAFQGAIVSSSRLPAHGTWDDAVTFFGDSLPPEIVKGKYYYAEETSGGLCIRERLTEEPIVFTPGEYQARLFRGIYQVYHAMYAPSGSGMSKGAMDLRYVQDFSVSGCSISASGDSTHFYHCSRGQILHNMIHGARMGAMFLAAYCKDVLVSHNIVNGGNGSRVLTVETGGEEIRIIGNIFYGGGRGTWIDTPQSILLENNVFQNNTCKALPDPQIGRLSPTQGTFERFAEIYFTTRQPGASYGNITLRSNVIRTGQGCTAALAFNGSGRNISVSDNLFDGSCSDIYISESCEQPVFEKNTGEIRMTDRIQNESFDIPGTIYLPAGQRK